MSYARHRNGDNAHDNSQARQNSKRDFMASDYQVNIAMRIDAIGGCHSRVAVCDTEHVCLYAIAAGHTVSGPDYARYVMLATDFYGFFTTVGMLYLHF